VRPRLSWRALLCAYLYALSAACGPASLVVPRAVVSATAQPVAAANMDPSLSAARELVALLPGDAEQCMAVMPGHVEPALEPLAALVSQVDRVPWALESEVLAYARAELTPHADRRRIVELIRFRGVTLAQVERDLTQHAGRDLGWGPAARACDDVLACPVSRVEAVDAVTLRITTGDWPYESERTSSACLALLDKVPHAVELSERQGAEGRGRGGVQRIITPTRTGLERIERRSYVDTQAAERARVKWLGGYQDQPQVAGVPVQPEYWVDGSVLSQRVQLSWDDLSLVVQDQERLRSALRGNEAPGPLTDDAIEAGDVEIVRAHVDARMVAIETLAPELRRESLLSLRDLLVRARGLHPFDEGLARRLFSLSLFGLNEPGEARHVADAMIARGSAHAKSWELSLRSALARLDVSELTNKLVQAHRLPTPDAHELAALLMRQVRDGVDYERAEWGALMARALAQRGQPVRTENAPALSLSPGSLVRVLALVASASPHSEESGVGIHVVLTGSQLRADATSSDASLWIQRTEVHGTPAVALAATSWDAAQVLALARAIDLLAPESSEILVAFDPLGRPERHGTLAKLTFQREAHGFVLQRVSKNLSRVRWSELVRQVADPLSRLQGSLFPPDALVIEAHSAEELQLWSGAVAPLDGMTCMIDGAALSCQGTLHDLHAAERALRAIARVSLAPEVRLFTSGVD